MLNKKRDFSSFKTRLEWFLKIQAHIILIRALAKSSEVQSEGREIRTLAEAIESDREEKNKGEWRVREDGKENRL